MDTLMLKGGPVRDQVFAELKEKVAAAPRRPGLAVVLVGDDAASAVYVSHKEKGCEEVGFHHVTYRMPADSTQEQVLARVQELNADGAIDGILVQLPLPGHLDQEQILLAVDPAKDVDGFHPENLGRLTAGHPRFVPCTPKGVLRLLAHHDISLAGKHVAIVGRSVIVGRPLAMLMSLKRDDANATVSLCHSGTRDLAAITRSADVVVAAIGVPRFLGRDEIAEGRRRGGRGNQPHRRARAQERHPSGGGCGPGGPEGARGRPDSRAGWCRAHDHRHVAGEHLGGHVPRGGPGCQLRRPARRLWGCRWPS